MRLLQMLCVVLMVLCSTVQSKEHSHSHATGNNNRNDRASGSQKMYEENTDFAFRLYKHISALPGFQSKNIFFSPLSVSVALSALSLGARGKTHQQLFEGLGFNATDITAEEVSQSFQSIIENLNNKTDVDLSLGNVLFIDETFKLRPEFLESMKRYYHSDGFSVDFTKTEEAKEQINKYVEEKTKGKIKKMVEGLDPVTGMYLINYIYFKGEWENPFDEFDTKTDIFHVDNDTKVPVRMMNIDDDHHVYYDEDISTHVLQLRYKGSVSMLLVLPEKGLQSLGEVLRRDRLNKWIHSLQERYYDVYVPKLSMETSYQLKEVLSGMGITDMFQDTADLSGVSEKGNLFVSQGIHKTTLDVSEDGTFASAATGFRIVPLSGWLGPTPILKFNRPFMIFVIDCETISILFMGKIENPGKQ
ncbi:hypothetical protein AGOR_G00045840 [Albula goreensis]|uniref:Thyroxine-binding globulin n=1 Tax=Albula goreensis TaxID=1534307 RepID=A0A8T3DSE0_9TELE|nr:hypothetical protein AGOR_G00045840 [Albula goreensis]